MKLAIVSDSHGSLDRLESVMSVLDEEDISHLLHLGDFLNYGVEEIFQNYPDISVSIARGNCDVNEELSEKINALENVSMKDVLDLELEGIRLAASHIEGVAQSEIKEKDRVDIFCHGHTHRKKIEKTNKNLRLNPGALCEDGVYFVLELPSMEIEERIVGA